MIKVKSACSDYRPQEHKGLVPVMGEFSHVFRGMIGGSLGFEISLHTPPLLVYHPGIVYPVNTQCQGVPHKGSKYHSLGLIVHEDVPFLRNWFE